jgi:hypothetical protein
MSSAQSKRAGDSGTEYMGGATGDGGVDSEWRVSLDVDSVVSDMAAVWEVVSDETARLRRFWGE